MLLSQPQQLLGFRVHVHAAKRSPTRGPVSFYGHERRRAGCRRSAGSAGAARRSPARGLTCPFCPRTWRGRPGPLPSCAGGASRERDGTREGRPRSGADGRGRAGRGPGADGRPRPGRPSQTMGASRLPVAPPPPLAPNPTVAPDGLRAPRHVTVPSHRPPLRPTPPGQVGRRRLPPKKMAAAAQGSRGGSARAERARLAPAKRGGRTAARRRATERGRPARPAPPAPRPSPPRRNPPAARCRLRGHPYGVEAAPFPSPPASTRLGLPARPYLSGATDAGSTQRAAAEDSMEATGERGGGGRVQPPTPPAAYIPPRTRPGPPGGARTP